jgi:hypothetical protein
MARLAAQWQAKAHELHETSDDSDTSDSSCDGFHHDYRRNVSRVHMLLCTVASHSCPKELQFHEIVDVDSQACHNWIYPEALIQNLEIGPESKLIQPTRRKAVAFNGQIVHPLGKMHLWVPLPSGGTTKQTFYIARQPLSNFRIVLGKKWKVPSEEIEKYRKSKSIVAPVLGVNSLKKGMSTQLS